MVSFIVSSMNIQDKMSMFQEGDRKFKNSFPGFIYW